MLILSRRYSESVVVGDPEGSIEHLMKVTVLGITRTSVKLGFDVAGDIPVNRWEVWHRIRASKEPESLGFVPPMSNA
jgi:carbon storage regulator CsrA